MTVVLISTQTHKEKKYAKGKEEMVIYRPKRGASEKTNSDDILISDFHSPEF